MPEKSPGQVAYESWAAAFFDHTPWPRVPWADLSPPFRAAWEEAAQAVLTHRPTAIELPRCTYCTAYASDTIHLCEEHYRLKETP